MSDRAVNDKDKDPTSGIVQLDNDERWQARLDEARARREVALREKAASDGPKKRKPKPWEVEPGVDHDEPFHIEPLLQPKPEKDVDFSDRVDTMRETKPTEKKPPESPPKRAAKAPPPKARKPKPKDDFDKILAKSAKPPPAPAAPKKEGPRLVAVDAPEVSEIAARYASSLNPSLDSPLKGPPALTIVGESDVDALWETDRRVVPPVVQKQQYRPRPIGLGWCLLLLALLPFTTPAPPLETGPQLESIPRFGFMPAWGLPTAIFWLPENGFSQDHRPSARSTPVAPSNSEFGLAPDVSYSILGDVPKLAASGAEGADPAAWQDTSPSLNLAVSPLFTPSDDQTVLPHSNFPDIAVPKPRPPVPEPGVTSAAEPDAFDDNAVAKPRPRSVVAATPDPAPEASPAAGPISPLRITLLLPDTTDRALAKTIETDLVGRGHEVARLKEVGVNISQRNLRYFHDSDRSEAARLAFAYQAELRDFTWFLPKPPLGTAELWLSGRSTRPQPAAETGTEARVSDGDDPGSSDTLPDLMSTEEIAQKANSTVSGFTTTDQ